MAFRNEFQSGLGDWFSQLGWTGAFRIIGAQVSTTLIWPVSPDDRGNLGQDYAQYDVVSAGKYHTALDIGASQGAIARAAADGIVRRLDMTPGRF